MLTSLFMNRDTKIACRFLTFIGTAIFSLMISCFAYADDRPVVLAVAGPMVGTSFSVGIQYRTGVTAAINSLLPDRMLLGRKVEIEFYDDGCNAKVALSLAQSIVQNPPDVVIGHSCSYATIEAAPIYAANNVLEIVPAFTNPKVTEMGIRTIFRMIGRDDIQGVVAAERLSHLYKDKAIGIVYFPGAYSTDLSNIVIEELAKRAVVPKLTLLAAPSSPSYASEINTLVESNLDAIYIVGGGLDLGVFMRQARQLNARFDVLSSDTLVSKVFAETAGEAAEGSFFTFPPEVKQFETTSEAQTAIKALGQEPVGYTLLAYAATQVWILGVQRAQSFEAAAVASALREAPLNTILGSISFDNKGDIITEYPAFVWYQWKGDKRVLVD